MKKGSFNNKILKKLFLVLIFLIVVKILFKQPAPCKWLEAVWSAGDFITFCGTIVLGIVACVQSQEANEMSQTLMEIEKNRDRLEICPFVMVTKWKMYKLRKENILYNHSKIYIEINDIDNEQEIIGFSLQFQNTTKSFITVEFSKGQIISDKKWSYLGINQPNRKLLLADGESEEMIFYASKNFMMNLEGKELELIFVLENRFGQRYKEKFNIIITHLKENKEKRMEFYCSCSIQNYKISKCDFLEEKKKNYNCKNFVFFKEKIVEITKGIKESIYNKMKNKKIIQQQNIKVDKLLKLIILIFILILVIPLLINILFSIDSPVWWLRANWSCGDLLSFYGAILTGIITIIGVFLTIRYYKLQNKDDLEKDVMPFIALTILQTEYAFDFENFGKIKDNKRENIETTSYREYELNKIYFIITNEEIKWKKELTAEQKELLRYGGISNESGNEKNLKLRKKNLISIPMVLENVGKGAAIQFGVGLHDEKTSYDDGKYSMPIHMKIGNKFYVNFYFPEVDKIDKGRKFIFRLDYENIYGERYIQEYNIKINDDNNVEFKLGGQKYKITEKYYSS